MKNIILAFIFAFILTVNAYGSGELSSFDTGVIENKAREETGLSFSSMFYSVINGDGSKIIRDIKDSISNIFIREIRDNSDCIKAIIIISLLCGILNTVSLDLKQKSVSELVFYVGEILVLTIAVAAFKECISVLKAAVNSVLSIITASIPFMLSVGAAAGKPLKGITLSTASGVLTGIINGVVIPLITASTLIKIVNLISGKAMLNKMSALFKDITSYIIKGGGYIFIFLMSFERIGGSTVSRFVGSSVKSAVGMVPVIGDVIEGGAEIAAGAAGTVASGSSVVIVIIIISAALVPVIKIGIIAAIYKVLAAVVEPICDKNTVEIIDTIGESCKLILGCLFMVVFMFVVSVLIMLGGLNG